MARKIGRRAGLLASGLLGLLALAPLALLAPLAGAFALAAGAGLAAILLHRRAAALAGRCEKLSGEFDVLSQRLLRLEAAVPTAKTTSETASLAAGVEEVTAEIGLLSGIVRELATVVSTQDGDIARLKAEPRASEVALKPASRTAPAADARILAPRIEAVAEQRPAPPVASPVASQPPTPPVTRSPAVQPVPSALPQLPRPGRDRAMERDREAALVAAFDGAGLEVHLQPVVALPQRKVVSYEALPRLRLGDEILGPDLFLPVLERHGRTTDLDRRMLQRVATITRHLQGRGSEAAVAYGLSPLSLFEPGFLRSLPRLVVGEPNLAGRLVVALPQASWRSLDAEQAGALTALRGRIGFSLDRPIDLRLDAAALAERGVTQVKMPSDLLLRPPSRGAPSDITVADLVPALARAGIRLVATGVEREPDVPDLIELDVPLAQGEVFAAPRAVRAEVLAPSAAAVPASPPATEEPPPPQRRPFRDFLRRAS